MFAVLLTLLTNHVTLVKRQRGTIPASGSPRSDSQNASVVVGVRKDKPATNLRVGITIVGLPDMSHQPYPISSPQERTEHLTDHPFEEIQKSRGDSLVQILARKIPVQDKDDDTATFHVIQRALDLLVAIHRAYVDSNPDVGIENSKRNGRREDPVLEDTKRRRVIHGLLDLISLEGIYPALSQGVGIPLQQRVVSVLPTGVVATQAEATSANKPHDERLLLFIIDTLRPIVCDKHSGIQPIIMGRILADILCATAELAFHSHSLPQEQITTYRELFQTIIEESPTPSLLTLLSSFIQTSSASWFKNIISSQLSQVPLRNDGVFQTVIFIASQFAPVLGQRPADTAPSQGPPITVQAIMQTSRLLSSLPQGISADDYFCNIAPKLLALLDGDEPDFQKTASYVIGSGILGKRALGEPGAIGYKIFVKPILDSLHGNMTNEVAAWLRRFSLDGSALTGSPPLDNLEGVVLIDEPKLLLSITRLSALVLLHPNPSLLKRLIQPVLLPLWALGCYAKEHRKPFWYAKVSTLLQTFFSVSTGVSRYEKLSDNILWDGGSTWTFGHGQKGGISIRKRTDSLAQEALNAMLLVKIVDDRIDSVLELLAMDPQSEELAGDVFLHVSQKWLLGSAEQHDKNKPELLQAGEDMHITLQKLASAKFTEKLLNKFKDRLSRHPDKILGIIEQLIQSEVALGTNKAHGKSKNPSFRSLGNIVENQEVTENDNPERYESLSAAFSLLSTILTSPDFSLSETLSSIIQRIKFQLDTLLPILPPPLVQPATTASMLAEITLSSSLPPERKSEAVSSRISDLETHRKALEHISSPLPPIQAEGLTLLSRLITQSSPVLDIPATLSLLLSLITNSNAESSSNDEFIYLNVVKIIGVLASKHPRTVIKTLAERYADRSEQHSLDQRLRIGEALLRTVQELGNALVENAARTLGETMIAVAGRRGRKPSAKRAREEMAETKSKTQLSETEDDALDREAADLMQQIDEAMDPEAENPALTAYSANIINAWAAGAASDLEPDDLRIRASAMSILASAIQTNLAGLGPSIASSSVDLALSTLNLERGPESVILRRAAVILLLDLVKALDAARESGINLGFGFSHYNTNTNSNNNPSVGFNGDQQRYPNEGAIGSIPDVLRVLTFVESNETDPIVRGHIRVLIESLEAWLEKSLLWGVRTREGMGEQPRFELGDRLAGLDIHPHLGGDESAGQRSVHGPRIEEIE
ncbi:hypothetical protein EMPG_13940 [Blastomyces silverae]|uniref:RNA polymerase II assembly factor Rtp1 C-terminal domain-containing protein n=1 Tax=Blastomyces silverae TaxID=2060906 RepID=A0A0H1BND8_9EURO|nr:hypothetical protein EMPG_13940 [Blastomyces silverae]